MAWCFSSLKLSCEIPGHPAIKPYLPVILSAANNLTLDLPRTRKSQLQGFASAAADFSRAICIGARHYWLRFFVATLLRMTA
jgi:hypothetical protein